MSPPPHPEQSGLSLAELGARLSELAPHVSGDQATRVLGVRQDSRAVQPGDLFAVLQGRATNGALYALEAEARGASALLLKRGEARPATRLPVLEVSDARRALSFAAEAVYGQPSQKLDVIGITGTNGKTTTSYLVELGLSALGARPARLGTLGFAFAGASASGSLTTPEADDLSRCMAEVQRRGGSHFVMEVSSIALAQERVAALRFRAAAFTNLTQDHLDFHGSLAEYGAAKARLFTELGPGLSVLHVGDRFGARLANEISSEKLTVARAVQADLRVEEARLSASGIRARVSTPRAECELESSLVGAHNLENLLVALGLLIGLGAEPVAAAKALSGSAQVPGRLERVESVADDVQVLVDYAHTPDALTRALAAVRGLGTGRLHCVFGCGGDRDPSKRPLMGRAVGLAADFIYLTSDNPRSEEPRAIADAVAVGLEAVGASYQVELDRAHAIALAVLGAQAGDVVLIAGKGHEDYQIIGAEKRPFDDREEARRALGQRRGQTA